MELDHIEIFGAREHNLKGVSVRIPKRKLVVFTGVSGSGKSSLAFDTLYAEGQRRYVESLSSYARQFLGQMDKPRYDRIRGLTPTISIEQKTTNTNPRSTVGTITEVADYLRVLYARVGTQHCPKCDKPVKTQSAEQIAREILAYPAGARVLILAPLLENRKGEHRQLITDMLAAGYVRLRIDGKVVRTEEVSALDKRKKHDVEAVIDRITVDPGQLARVTEAVESALRLGKGTLLLSVEGQKDRLFSENASCCGVSFPAPTPQSFSFNSPQGMCEACNGLGRRMSVSAELLIPDERKTIDEGAVLSWGAEISQKTGWAGFRYQILVAMGVPVDVPVRKLTKKQRQMLIWGTGERKYKLVWKGRSGQGSWESTWEGVVPRMERRFSQTKSEKERQRCTQFMSDTTCASCAGGRMRAESAAVRVGGVTLVLLSSYTVAQASAFFEQLQLQGASGQIAVEVLKEIRSRLAFLAAIGLGYLSLDRTGPTLSGGESQRIRLASQVGSELTGVTYVLDEPSIGLHQRDNRRLLDTLLEMRDIGNTVVAVEHDEETIQSADYVVDFGPGAGVMGGNITFAGTPAELLECKESLTGDYLAGRRTIARAGAPRSAEKWLKIKGARQHNLKELDVDIPLGVLTAVTGVSGAGKSTLINEILYPALAREYHQAEVQVGHYDELIGMEHLDKVIDIDQRPIGRTPRSNPVTYIKVFDDIRGFFAELPLSKTRGYGQGRFSFNVKGGRCESCQGDGVRQIEMHFLADVYVPCEACRGRRFNAATLEVQYKGKSIADVLDLTVREATELFAAHPRIVGPLRLLAEVGLDYLGLGQPSPTLSGGEAQRIKLARELSRKATGRTLYILDEPTTGLHFEDVVQLLGVLQRLVDAGNTVLVIEHHLDVIRAADWIIDLGPEGGPDGGQLLAAGTPEQVAQVEASHTGRFLRAKLTPKPLAPTPSAAPAASASNRRASTRGKRKTARSNGRGRVELAG
ncbi:MAG: excinuclease subunit [Pseudomonadota bacterium]